MKVWISKYALTKGIYQLEVDHMSDDEKSVYGRSWDECFHGKNKEWHIEKESAIARAEDMKKKKIDSLRKKIEELESLEFQ